MLGARIGRVDRCNTTTTQKTGVKWKVAERERKFREREMLNEKIAAKIIADRAAILEREDIVRSLQEQEYLEKNIEEDIAEASKAARNKRDTEAALSLQIQLRRQQALQQLEKEAQFRRQVQDTVSSDTTHMYIIYTGDSQRGPYRFPRGRHK
ncbi:hypothetical protein RR48_00308 [Papilio machaon]|uniref:Uncharacterized protein n=1 Tax=Papilio machaon TaxID=76193 RepID=A0A0N1IQQ1_PAPMA|nr:hypothetical protein RR48_00308 [Papilio machaon]